jgi:hypothetical protein
MAEAPVQTPVLHLEGAGGVPWPDPACRAALIACGIDPDGFGTYSERLKAQGAEREKYRDKVDAKVGKGNPHPSPCSYPKSPPCECYKTKEAFDECMKEQPGGAAKWLRMNSQSGHMSRDEWYRAKPANPGDKTREDPCANHPPTAGNAGGYGNDSKMAFCTDHVGLSRGQEHWRICGTERQHAKDVKADPELQGMMPEKSLAKQVDATTNCMIDSKVSGPGGQPVSSVGKLSPQEIERAKNIDAARAQMAKEKADDAVKKGQVPPGTKPSPGKPNDVSDADPTKTNREKAKECIRDAWKQAVQQMRQKAENESSIVSARKQEAVDEHKKKHPPPPEVTFEQLSKEEQDEARRKVQEDMKKFGQEKNLSSDKSTQAKDPGPPTQEDCLNYQGAWLFTHKDANGNFPPMQGRAPGAAPPSTNAPNDGPPADSDSPV